MGGVRATIKNPLKMQLNRKSRRRARKIKNFLIKCNKDRFRTRFGLASVPVLQLFSEGGGLIQNFLIIYKMFTLQMARCEAGENLMVLDQFSIKSS